MTNLNIDLLRECVEWAEKEDAKGPFDSHWNQGGWATPMRVVLESRGLTAEQDDAPICGTAYWSSLVNPFATHTRRGLRQSILWASSIPSRSCTSSWNSA